MNKGFALPIVLTLLLIGFVLISFFTDFLKSIPNVKGVSSEQITVNSVLINSTKGTWELNLYSCSSINECTKSLSSGIRIHNLAGGITKDNLLVSLNPFLSSNSPYLKIIVKSGLGSPLRKFSISGDVQHIYKVEDYPVFVIDTNSLISSGVLVTFTD